MPKTKQLTATAIESLKKAAPGKRIRLMDTKVTNFGVSVTDKGTKTFFLVARFPGRKSKRTGRTSGPARQEIGKVGQMTLADAREKAIKWNALIKDGKDPTKLEAENRVAQVEKDATTVGAVLDLFVKRHVKPKGKELRSAKQIEHAFTYIRPRLGAKSIYDLKRSDIIWVLDAVEDSAGPVMADRVLAHVRKAFNWQATRDDDFKSPIVRGMARTKPKERSRKRILADDEIRDLWTALDTAADLPACYPRFVKSLLLCATRRNESAFMKTSEFEGDNWTIPGDRYKNKLDHTIPLSGQARALIGDKPSEFKGDSWFVFSTTGGKKGFSGFSKAKRSLDAEIAKNRKGEGRPPMPNWTLHDLRRTARSLMSRAKVPTDHAERALGHVIGGVRETYDRHEYIEEKRAAFGALAGMVDLILKPPSGNVISLLTRA